MEDRVKEIYALRRNGQLSDALSLAMSLLQEDSNDDDYKKALAWVAIDFCKKQIENNELDKAQYYFNLLQKIEFHYKDEFVESIQKQIRNLKPKIDIFYVQIEEADNLSKNGQEKLALEKIRTMVNNDQLSESNHETYGWIIYRYIKAEKSNLSSVEVRTFFRDYLNLKNERPSKLHSVILNFALNYSKTDSDFKFYNFFLLWNPDKLRNEDLHDGYKDSKNIPSLISRICKEFVNTNTIFDIEEILISKIKFELMRNDFDDLPF